MKIASLRFGILQDKGYRIRPASDDDWSAIERLLVYAGRQYMTLEWWTIQEWLGRSTFLMLTDQHDRCLGIMLTVVGDGAIAWLRSIVVASDKYLLPLLEASVETLVTQGVTGLAFLGDDRWIISRLGQRDFHRVNRVVTLRRRDYELSDPQTTAVQVRPATPVDLDDILAVDHVTFPPMWWYSREVLTRAMRMAICFHVAYCDGTCVGYQLSTLRHGRGHIVRLAVHPNWQRLGIGGRLLSEAMMSLSASGARSITVNTQEDNLASLRLYRRFTFQQIGKPWSVWFRSLEH